jgi:cytochrome c peroxidase
VTFAKSSLGKALFWDEQLSSTRTVACGACHMAASGSSDPRSIRGSIRSTHPGLDGVLGTPDDVTGSPGVPSTLADGSYAWATGFGLTEQVTGRKANSAINAAYSPELFWDGRATPTFRDPITNAIVLQNGAALESQVLAPPVSGSEMAHSGRDWNDVAARVAASKPLALSPSVPSALADWIDGRPYADLFAEAFGSPGITPARIAMAIASYERTLFSNQTPFDSFLAGGPPLTPQEEQGRLLFTQSRCDACHRGGLLSDNVYHYIGVRPVAEDEGRFVVTGNPVDRGAFRTPSLRNVELRGPYFHSGRFDTLEEVVDFYNRGGDFNAPNKSPLIVPLGLNPQQRAALVAFLRRPLTDPRVASESAPFDRPRLYSEAGCVPDLIGEGRAGTDGLVPAPIAIEPPIAGNPSFTVAVVNALGASTAELVISETDPGEGPSIPSAGAFAYASVSLQGAGAGNGYGSASVALADDPALYGRTLYGRWFVHDPAAPGGVAASPAFVFTIFDACREAPCFGDANNDRSINFDDITAVLLGWGSAGATGDANMDGVVDFEDLNTILAGFGSTCVPS